MKHTLPTLLRCLTTLCLLIWTISTLPSCKDHPEVRFLAPQPFKKQDLTSFPKRFQGTYREKSDSSILTIGPRAITTVWNLTVRTSGAELKEELDTLFYREDRPKDTLASIDNLSVAVMMDAAGDSATVALHQTDTLFILNDESLLRMYKGYLFLNNRRQDGTWRIRTLHLEKNELSLEDLVSHVQVDSLRAITPIETIRDTTSNEVRYHVLNPQRKELKKILSRKDHPKGYIKIDSRTQGQTR